MEERRPVKQDRSALLYFVFSVLTLGIYHWFFFWSFVKDINQICEDDGRHTRGVFTTFLFSLLTLGIYRYVWVIGVVDRMGENAGRFGIEIRRSGIVMFLLMFFLPGLGDIIVLCLIIGDMNRLARAYEKTEESVAKQDRARYIPSTDRKNENEEAKDRPQKDERISEETVEVNQKKMEFGGLQGLTGAYAGSKIPIGVNQTIVLGRDASSVALVIEGEKISRIHCSIQYSGKRLGYHVTDHSRNGVFVNGVRIPYDVPTYASAGSIVALADGANKFQLMEYDG